MQWSLTEAPGPKDKACGGFGLGLVGVRENGVHFFFPGSLFFCYVAPAISIGVTSHLRAVVARSDIQSLSSGLGSERSQGSSVALLGFEGFGVSKGSLLVALGLP